MQSIRGFHWNCLKAFVTLIYPVYILYIKLAEVFKQAVTKLFMGRAMRGNLRDQVFLTVVFLAFSMSILISYTIWSAMSPALNETLSQSTGGVLNAGSALAITQTNATLLMFDQLFIFMIIGTLIAIVISSFFLNTHPIFFILSFIFFIFEFVIFAILGNIYGEFETAAQIQAAASNYPLMEMFWMNVPTIGLVFAVLIIIILYTSMRGKGNAYSA